MSLDLMGKLSHELAPLGKSLVVQAHRDGDPLDAPNLGYFVRTFSRHILSLVTHGETLLDHAEHLIGLVECVTVSIFRGDPDRELQLDSLTRFLKVKGDRLPRDYIKLVGGMDDGDFQPYAMLGVPVLSRRLHLPESNRRYTGGLPPLPEHGLCLDLLSHPSVAWDGRVYLCNRLDSTDAGLIGNLSTQSLDAIWNGPERQRVLDAHIAGRRNEIPACASCVYYGIPAA
jgi:radical SAM protein with 4Fe4S-binding SPASM domain